MSNGLPSIPSGVTTESTLAVLFMVVLGVSLLVLLLKQLPGLIATWRASTPPPAPAIDRAALATLESSTRETVVKMDRVLDKLDRIEDAHLATIRQSLHDLREQMITFEARLYDIERKPATRRPR